VTDDRQTDHAMEKCVGIGGIASAARAIPPNDTVDDDVFVSVASLRPGIAVVQ